VTHKLTLLIAALALAATSLPTQAQSRTDKWDFSIQLKHSDSKTINGGSGSSAQIDGVTGFGLGLAYNFNEHLSLGGDFDWTNPDYHATVTPAVGNANAAYKVNGSLSSSSLHGVLTWNFLSGPVTPFVSGGLGGTWVITDIPAGPPINVCWWDPWWGYYCGSSVPVRSGSFFSYNASAGMRFDLDRRWSLRAQVTEQWVDVGGSVGMPSTLQYRVDLGYRF
jgi:opacity protein-like surface antigen